MKYLALTLNIMRKRWLFHVILVMELAALLILTNVMTATVNSKTMLLEPYRALMNEKGAVVQVENLMIMEECTNEEIRPFLKTYPDLKGIIGFLEKRLAGQVKIHYTEHINFFQPVGPHSVMFHDKGETPYYYLLDRDILDKMQLPLSCGHWPCGERNAAGEAEIVISGGTDAHLNDVYDTPAGKIRVVGILTDNTYRPIGSNIDRSDMTAEVDRDSIFNYILPFDSQTNLGGPFAIASKDAFSENQEGYEIIPDTIWFVTYGNDISEEDFKANTDYLNTVGTVQYGETLSTLAEESERKINDIYYRMMPMIITAVIMVLLGFIGSAAISAVRQIRTFGIFYLCGCRKKDCISILAAETAIILLFSLLAAGIGLFILQQNHFDYLIGMTFGVMNVVISLLLVLLLFVLSMILPFGIIKTSSPILTLKERV